MKRNIHNFNNLLRTYNRYRRKLTNLRKANKNERRQHILQNHLTKLYEKLMVLKMSVKFTTIATSVVVGSLAFTPQSASAQISFGTMQTNPFGLMDIGNKSAPTFADLDGDGDVDIVTAASSGNFIYFENIGTSSSPIYTTPQTNPFGITNAGTSWVDLVFVDIDSDGDLDLLYGNYPGQIIFLENIGTSISPSFSSFQVNPFGLTNVPALNITPTVVDIDSDGDFDIFSVVQDGKLYYYQNIGTSTGPNFSSVQTNPFGFDNLGFNFSNPFFVDIDSDGDMDLFTGEFNGNFKYYENTGTSAIPSFLGSQINPFNLTGISSYISNPTFADLDNDGDLDLISGEYYGNFKYFENTSTLAIPCLLIDQIITAAQTTLCDSGSTTIDLGSSEVGVNYVLRNDADSSIVAGPIAGTGAGISLNTGTITTTTTYNVYAEKPNSSTLIFDALQFTGNAGLKKVSLGTSLWNTEFAGTTKLTVEAWVKRSATGSLHTVIGNYDGAYPFLFRIDNDKIRLFINSTTFVESSSTISVGTWTHVAGTYDGTNINIYVNGVLENSIPHTNTFISSTNETKIGGGLSNNTEYFLGDIGEIRLWKVARTPAEIMASYNQQLTGNESGLVVYYKFDESSGSTAFNSAVNGMYDGTLINNPARVGGTTINAANCFIEMAQTATVIVNNFTTGSQTFVECAGFSVTVGTNTYNATGIYTDVLTGSNGCDSTVTTDLTIKQPTTSSQTFVECAGFSVTVGTNTYNTTGVFTDVLVGSNGCDSTVTTDLTIKQPTTGSQTFVECAGFSVTVGTNTYNATGVFTDILVASNGCDSTVTTDLTIKQPTTGSQTLVECAGFSVTVGTNTYNATGVYTDVLTNAAGCDSTVTTDLTVEQAIDVTVDNTLTPTLSANQTGATYQWLDCDNGNAIIPSETAQSFTATVNGNYAVEITVGSCVDTSACENISTVGVKENANTSVSIYPNPTSGLFTISLTNLNGEVSYTITTLEGSIVKQENNISTSIINVNLSNESKGVYLLKINEANTNKVYKIVRQ